METLITHLSLNACVNRLRQLADNHSFFPKTGKKSIHITFTQFRPLAAQRDNLPFNLNARCNTYRGIGILYLQLSGKIELRDDHTHIRYKVQPGFPTSSFEWVFGIVWNLIIISAGIILIISAAELPATESIPRYGFLPFIYGIYGIRLAILYRRATKVLPKIIANWCQQPV